MLTDILAYREIDADLATAGLPTEAQLHAVAAAGFTVVINLSPDSPERVAQGYALANEQAIVEALGMHYYSLPVPWDAPTPQHVDIFCQLLENATPHKVFIHCALNRRVSAFLMLYRITRLHWPREAAEADMLALWGDELAAEPQWQNLITQVLTPL